MAAGDFTAAQTLVAVSQTATGGVVHDVPGAIDTFSTSNVALLHLDGANGSTTFADAYGHTFSGAGSAALSTAQKKFGTASLFLNGTSQYIQSAYTSDWDMPGDFTAELWFYANSIANDPTLIDRWSTYGWQIFLSANGRAYALLQNSGGAVYTLAPEGSVPLVTTGEWHHIALTRSGDTVRFFIDGLMHVALPFTGALPAVSSAPLYIGCQNGALSFFSGYLDEIRLTKGIARYLGDFIPPSVAFFTPDTTLRQRLVGVTQTATATVTAAADRNIAGAQTLASVSPNAAAQVVARLAATQTVAGVAQVATATAATTRSLAAAQTLAGAAQSAAAAVLVNGAASQLLADVTQVATGSVPDAASFFAAQSLGAAAQAATASVVAKAAAVQPLDGVGQSAAASSSASAAAVQTLDAAVGAATAIALARAQAAQTLAGVSQTATATVTDAVRTFIAAQILASVVQVARVRPTYTFERNERTLLVAAERRRSAVAGELRSAALIAEQRTAAIRGERRRIAFTD